MRNPILKIAIPSIVSNITVPLLALVDTTIVGHFGADARLTDAPAEQPGAAVYLGAIAVGGMLFNMIYWLFSFLRMGTGGMTAQACGARQTDEALRILLRSLTVATSMALLFILFKAPMLGVFFQFMEASVDTEMLARQYIDILVFGAPAVLGLYSFTGWFLGMQNAKYPMYIAIVQNIVNIVVSLWLVMALHWRMAGVAVGTLVAQYAGLLMAILLWRRHYGHLLSHHALKTLWQRGALKRFFTVNRDIFFRTLCLVGVTSCFTAFGTAMGDATLAANTLLMQFFVLFSYIMDGFAYAGEALGGRYVGEGNEGSFRCLTKSLFLWGAALVGLYSLVYVAGGESFLRLLTNDASVVAAALPYLPLACAIPVVSAAAFIFDGLFIGATATRQMLQSMAAATLTFFAVFLLSQQTNVWLWTAFLCYLGMRGLVQALLISGIRKKIFGLQGK